MSESSLHVGICEREIQAFKLSEFIPVYDSNSGKREIWNINTKEEIEKKGVMRKEVLGLC